MEVKISSEKVNPLLDRREISFHIDHDFEGTPRLFDVKKAIALICGVNEELVYVIKLKTLTGINRTIGKAEIYYDAEKARLLVPKHIQLRNQLGRGKDKQ